jgi:general secretion pathway protein E
MNTTDKPVEQAMPNHAQDVVDRLLQRHAAMREASPDDDAVPSDLSAWLSLSSGMPLAQLSHWRTEEVDVSLIPFAEAQRRLCAALRAEQGPIEIVLVDPFDSGTRLWIEARVRAAGHPATRWSVAAPDELLAFFRRLEREMRALDGQVNELPDLLAEEADGDIIELSLADISTHESPVVRFVNSTLYDALKAKASDIHLECTGRGMAVKYRLDGVLQAITRIDGREFADRVVSRIKVVADLDISERRVPQDGRLKLRLGPRSIDVRVSIMPSLYGEDAVLRILDRYQIAADERLSIDHLSFNAEEARFIRHMAHLPYGLFLVTGPTGSGKTTTLYGVLSEVNTGLDKIITIEDPVEYQVPDILQIPVNEAKGLTFAKGLRSILRHDPDKIMVGEMRDTETAQIAIQAALTGHQVFATVHANNVFDVIGRLSTMEVDPYNLVSALNGVLAQRLIRVVCTACAKPESPDAALLAESKLPPEAVGWTFVRGIGCAHCRGTGYKGRQAIAQMLAMDVELRSLIAERASPARLRAAARERGLGTLRDAALTLVAAGTTTLEEANRVTAAEE